ncbi:hypothetical protein PM082_006301 [Marasmius tenuissimus]|nr:hypothetical protein PM082_006301 [Marasmius tenuissimus]
MTGRGVLPGDFVQIGRHAKYRGDVGLVVDVDRDDLMSVSRARLLVPPRIPYHWRLKVDQSHFNDRALEYSSEDRLNPNHEDFYLRPFHYKEWLAAGWKWKADLVPHCRTHRCKTPKDPEVPNVEGHCRPCQDWEMCPEAYLVFQKREFQDMLESIWVKNSRLSKADSIAFHAGVCFHVSQFQNQQLYDSLSDLPPPRGWDFTIGDRVFIVKPHVTPEPQPKKFLTMTISFLKHYPDESHGCEGSIVSVLGSMCKVRLDDLLGLVHQATNSPEVPAVVRDETSAFEFQPLRLQTSDPKEEEGMVVSVSQHHIRRSLRPGDEVEVIDGIEKGANGWIFNVTEDWNAVVMVNDPLEPDRPMSQLEPHMITTTVNFLRPYRPCGSTVNQAPRQLTRTFGVAAAPDGVLANVGLCPQTPKLVQHRQTERNPWIGTRVRIIKHKSGSKDSGVVRSVHVAGEAPIGRPNKTNNVSGLIINVESDTRRQRTGNIAVDYNNVRDLDSGRFLNQVRPLAEDSFWKQQFRPFYFELYSDKEERELKDREENKRLQEMEREQRMREEAERRLVAPSNGGTPPPGEDVDAPDIGSAWDLESTVKFRVDWLISPTIVSGLQGMKVLVDISSGRFKARDRYVQLEYDGEDRPHKIVYYPPRVQRRVSACPMELAELDKSSDRPKLRTEARMMIVIEGDHLGKLVYRVGQRYVSEEQSEDHARLIVRVVVNVDVIASTCKISEEELLLHESSLAIVKDDQTLRLHARQQLDKIRQENKNKLYL